jgi:hypothetical protein
LESVPKVIKYHNITREQFKLESVKSTEGTVYEA